jgi:TorA maturation chaperone TorD
MATSEPRPAGSAAITLHHRLEPEDQARADFYALLARLYAEAPDAALLRAIAGAPPLGVAAHSEKADESAASLPAAWDLLRAASEAMDADAATDEYNNLFVGVGKSEVNLHASHWLTGFMMEKPLADVRATLARLGLGRRAGVSLVEDHLAALLETMRILVAGQDDRRPASLAEQRAFFEQHIVGWAFPCCSAIRDSPVANYYRTVAQFTINFLALERDSFAID